MTTAIESKQDATKQSQKEQLETFSCMLDIGEAMLAAGADVDTVEDILVKMGKAYGAYKMDVLVITELIIATATMPGHNEHTLSRRILNEGSTNFDRLEALTDLCKSYCQSLISADDLRKSLQRIKGKPFPKVSLYLGGALAAGGFAIFFGGSLVDGLVSAFFALGVCFCIKHFQKLTPNAMVFNFLTSFIFGILICLASKPIPAINIDMVIIGVIVLVALVVGVWFFNGSKIPSYVGYPLEGDEKEQVIEQNSPLTDFVYLTANADYPRDQPISKITIHHMGGDLALGNLGERFQKRDIQASSNYAIDSKGNVALYVEEANRAWTSKNRENDEQAITIEVANDEEGGNWHVSNETFDKLVLLCADICKRNGIEEIVYTGDTTGNLTFHGMFDSTTECPGPYLKSRMNDLADAINAELAKSE